MALASLALLAACAAAPPAATLPPECMNGTMEQRQALGMDPFAPPCDELGGAGRPPIQPLLVAKRNADAVLADEALFRNLIRLGVATGDRLQPARRMLAGT